MAVVAVAVAVAVAAVAVAAVAVAVTVAVAVAVSRMRRGEVETSTSTSRGAASCFFTAGGTIMAVMATVSLLFALQLHVLADAFFSTPSSLAHSW